MDEQTKQTIDRMEDFFRHQLMVACDIGVYIDLSQAITQFLLWMESNGYTQQTIKQYKRILNRFLSFIKTSRFSWDEIFTANTLESFKKITVASNAPVIVRFARYLYSQKSIRHPIESKQQVFPDVFQQYLDYRQKTGQTPSRKIKQISRVLSAFNDYLEKHKIDLPSVRIEHIDTFLAQFNQPFAPTTCRIYRSYLRGFLTYLYQHCGILNKDYAPLVVGAPLFAQSKPPKFLRPHEVNQLFDSLKLTSARDLRNYAMVHLAYYLGLRPAEISLITLDDISFGQSELAVKNRKNAQEIALPLPENTLKAIVAYIVGARPKSNHRRLFLTLCAPCRPIAANVVTYCITVCMRQAGLSATAYWLRHTYAQNLLETGASIYEIKEMLGHDSIETSQKYLHINVKLMRKVLFDEEL